MRVFITGGTGLIGSAVIAELLAAGHFVTALTRSEASAAKARAGGADTVPGGLADLDDLREAAAAAEGVIHLAFGNDFSSPDALAANIAEETAALETLGNALLGTGKPLVTVSGTPQADGRPSTEVDPLPTFGPVAGRSITVERILALADRGVRTSSIRLPRTVHNNGGGGFAGLLTQIARRTGVAGYPGNGAQRWPAVHALDAAAHRLVVEGFLEAIVGRFEAGAVREAVAGAIERRLATVLG